MKNDEVGRERNTEVGQEMRTEFWLENPAEETIWETHAYTEEYYNIETGYGNMNWIRLTQDRIVMNLRIW